MTRYYCSGFDINDCFGYGLGQMFKSELKNMNSIVFIPGGISKVEKAKSKYVPLFLNHFKNVGIEFQNAHLITPELLPADAKQLIKNASFIMLMGGDPFSQKELCVKLGIMDELKNYNGLMLGFSAGAMLMSKHIIVTPCSEEYPDFRIEEGLNLDGISIYPHNNTPNEIYPDELVSGDETYKKSDLLQVAKQYGKFYLLQDNVNSNGKTDISVIKSVNGNIEFYTENEGKIWLADNTVNLVAKSKSPGADIIRTKMQSEYNQK